MDPTQDFNLFSKAFAAENSVSFLSGLNPTPSFPSYSGPYPVGTLDCEVPTSEVLSPSPSPDPSITTVSFRIFYPCNPPQQGPKSVYWLPDPQRQYLKAYAQFLGASSDFSGYVQYLPFLQLLSWTTIPAIRNAYIRTPPKGSGRWPVMVFSHGLGGSKNAYSHLCGSLASYGLVVIAPDHRDGSSPVSFVRDAEGRVVKKVDFQPLPHTASKTTDEARDQQLKIRLWELGMIHKILVQLDHGRKLTNYGGDKPTEAQPQQSLYSKDSLAALASKLMGDKVPDTYKPSLAKGDLTMFQSKLDVNNAGKIAWAGHSLGAAAVVQFIKTVYYSPGSNPPASYQPLYTPGKSSSLTRQITPQSPVLLLDLWCLPLESASTQWLWQKPMPSYAESGPAGVNLLAILSEAFFKWRGNLLQTKRILSEKPSLKKPQKPKRAAPSIFYPIGSAHLSQSDFGVLFPFMTKRAFGAKDPARVLRLNTRAILQVLRNMEYEVAGHSSIDMEESRSLGPKPELSQLLQTRRITDKQDEKILSMDGGVQGWLPVKIDEGLEGAEGLLRAEKKKTPAQAVAKNETGKPGKPGPVQAVAKNEAKKMQGKAGPAAANAKNKLASGKPIANGKPVTNGSQVAKVKPTAKKQETKKPTEKAKSQSK